MGRTETSKGLAPPAIRKDIRAKQARHIINKVIPALLASSARARKGVGSSELIVNPKSMARDCEGQSRDEARESGDSMYVKRKGRGRRKVEKGDVEEQGDEGRTGRRRSRMEGLGEESKEPHAEPLAKMTSRRTIRVLATDSLTAAHMLTFPPHQPKPRKNQPNTCILNMASPLRPGGGVLTGATSQEEFLCARTTLLPSLLDSYYRLPEYGGVYTPDVLVFRNHLPLGDSKGELPAAERWWVDVVSAGMLRFPELEGGEEDEARWLSRADRESAEGRMRAVLRICARNGVKKVVLGAWGCGAFGCPVGDIAEGWRKVLEGCAVSHGGKGRGKSGGEMETFLEIEEVVFAIGNRPMAQAFAQAYGGVEVEEVGGVQGEDEEEVDEVAEELRTKIREMEEHLGKVCNPDLKKRMGFILDGLKGQLRQREGSQKTESESANDDDDYDDSSSEA
ncbi:hypothetical protein LEMA_P108240.1 [Plenodomus lingam JN3]|uniref:Microbial-type PARG catalytic domain-containing protein n=1 Tax=Leptosphaeria maculans (strain JN3 / isolate v23.1.3 / race Av1-4-5-6-7-8) TaxID=985895 RepID=E4ZYN3_LEPMJ|nr:hypothetical protein LEMA_P108240.1 [Plenodomus lingam JN3]CBX96559.1 hypothetical protein LEMA_P108240.1 [Plenodomus lingam JN3]